MFQYFFFQFDGFADVINGHLKGKQCFILSKDDVFSKGENNNKMCDFDE